MWAKNCSQFKKLTSVCYAFVLLLLMINCAVTYSKLTASGSAVNFDDVMTKFIINKSVDA